MSLSLYRGNTEVGFATVKEHLFEEISRHEGDLTLLMAGGRSVPLMFDLVGPLATARDGAVLLADERLGLGVHLNGTDLVREAQRCACAWPIHQFSPGAHVDRAVLRYEALFATRTKGPLIAMLSVGEDGHIASLFPGHVDPAVPFGRLVLEHDAPKEPRDRVSFSLATFQSAHAVVLLFMGEAKRAPLTKFLKREPSLTLPLAGLTEHPQCIVVTDLEED